MWDGVRALKWAPMDGRATEAEMGAKQLFRRLRQNGRCRHQDRRRNPVEPAHVAIGQRLGDKEVSPEIFRKARVIRGRKLPLASPAERPHRQPDRAFGGNMDGVGAKGVKLTSDHRFRC